MNDQDVLSNWAKNTITGNTKHISHNLTELETPELIRTIVGISVMLNVPLSDMTPVVEYLQQRNDLEDCWEIFEGNAFIRRSAQLKTILSK